LADASDDVRVMSTAHRDDMLASAAGHWLRVQRARWCLCCSCSCSCCCPVSLSTVHTRRAAC